MLIEKYNLDINLASLRGWRPIHLVLGQESKAMAVECLQYLLSKGADVNVHLSHAMWKANKKHQLQQMCKLESIKADWLLKKGLPWPSPTLLSLSQVQRHSLTLRKLAGQIATPIPSLSILFRGNASDSVLSMQHRYRRQKPWNFSTNLDSEPATSICRPALIRLGVEAEKLPRHDFTSFLFLFKDPFGDPVIQIDNIGRVCPVPDLPYEVLHQSLYPHTWMPRMEVPRDLRPVHIFNLKHRRPPGPEHWWTDQMALSLRVTLDPIFLSSLQSHVSTYCSAKALSPRTVSLGSPKETPSVQSEASSP
ncbi:Ankyrin repeat domain-containing protein 53, partial [Ophiophagus hannah]